MPDALAFLVNGKTEVWPPSGFIDVLSDTEAIEVQYCRAWKNGIGQIVAWGFHYLRLARRLHLLAQAGDTDTGKYVDLAKAVCDSNAIKVTFEEVVQELAIDVDEDASTVINDDTEAPRGKGIVSETTRITLTINRNPPRSRDRSHSGPNMKQLRRSGLLLLCSSRRVRSAF